MMSLLAGLLAGLTHVLAGPDHWVSVAPLSMATQPKGSVRIGLRWGLGHALGILMLGALGLALKDLLDMDQVSKAAEGLVGVFLVLSGFWALRRSKSFVVHSHPHQHGEESQTHKHLHVHLGREQPESETAHQSHTHAAFGLGLLHGVAGASALWAILPTFALPTASALVYLAAFLISSIFTMATFTYLLGQLRNTHRSWRLDRTFTAIGWGSIALGVYWAGAAALAA